MQQEQVMKIFAVDSNLFSLMILKQQLRNMNYTEVCVFDNSEVCIKKLTDKPNVVIINYRIKPKNGIELLQKIKQLDPSIYVVFVASLNDVQVAMKSLDCGAFDYILKGDSAARRIENVLEKIQDTEAFIVSNKKDYRNWIKILH